MAVRGRNSWVCLCLVACLTVLVRHAQAYGSGAPGDKSPTLCDDLTPGHAALPQSDCPPYTITFSPQTFTAGGSDITVTLSGSGNFQGFLLTTQYADSNVDQSLKPGSFSTPSGSQKTCSNGAVTHTSSNNKNSIIFNWTPPAISQGNIRFRVTFLKVFSTFWVDFKPANLLVDSASSSGSPVADPSATVCTPAGTTVPTTTGPAGTITKDPECGKTKGCYSECSGSSCRFLMTWAEGTSANNVAITLSAVVSNPAGRYIAFGLSTDSNMGSDSVTQCINEVNGVYNSYNDGKRNRLLSSPQAGLSNMATSYVDGVLSCSFLQDKSAAVDANGDRFALDSTYTIFFAQGPGISTGISQHEDIPLSSSQSASLIDFTADITGSADFPLIKAHGSLMIVAWVFAASIGIIFARFFKNVWEESSWFGQKVWFQIHRTLMTLVLLATAIAFIIIFVEVGGYSDIQGEGYQKAHPIMGIIVMVLAITNPIMAMFRPHPNTPKRPIFNWLHWAVGTGGYTLGIITIFFGVAMEKAGAPDYITYILAAFVAWQFLVQVVLEIIQCMGRNADRSQSYEMSDINEADRAKAAPPRKSTFNKQVIIFLHILVVTCFTIALIAVLNVGEDEDGDDD